MSRIIKRILIIFGACMFLILFFAIQFDVFSWVFYPTKSSPHELTIVHYSGGYGFPYEPTITLKQYVNGSHICDYVLELQNGVFRQEPQSYELPKLDNGKVEVNVKFRDETNSSVTLAYEDAETFYQNGLLIYLAHFDTHHVYFVSGKETTCYNKATDSDEFTIATEFPSLRVIPAKENPGYYAVYSGWKENKWVVEEINN